MRLALLEALGFLLRQRAGFLALLDAPLLVGLALVDARRALRLRERRQRESGGGGERDGSHELHVRFLLKLDCVRRITRPRGSRARGDVSACYRNSGPTTRSASVMRQSAPQPRRRRAASRSFTVQQASA